MQLAIISKDTRGSVMVVVKGLVTGLARVKGLGSESPLAWVMVLVWV
jgi:hypothetical protein